MSLASEFAKRKIPGARVVRLMGLNRLDHDKEVRRERDALEHNREKHRQRQRELYQRKRDEILEKVRKRRAANKSYREANRRYYVRNRSTILEKRRAKRRELRGA